MLQVTRTRLRTWRVIRTELNKIESELEQTNKKISKHKKRKHELGMSELESEHISQIQLED